MSQFGSDGTVDDLIELYVKLCNEKVEYEVHEAEEEDDEHPEHDNDEEAKLLAELEKIKKERADWAKNASLEFYEEDPKVANGMLIAMASKRLQARIYHQVRHSELRRKSRETV